MEGNGVLCFSLDSGFRRNDGGGTALNDGPRLVRGHPRCPAPLDSGFRRNDGGG